MIGFNVPRIMPQGWTPMVWEQNMRRQTGELQMFSRCCGWIDDVRAIDVRLCDEPLYGRTLRAVACPPDADAPEKQAESAARSRTAFSTDFPVRKRESRPAIAMDMPAKREKVAPPSGLERKVSREKLLHRAGDLKTPAGKSAASTPVMPELNAKRTAPPVKLDGDMREGWLKGMTERAGAGAALALSPADCQRSLDGVTVSRDLLTGLAIGMPPSREKSKAVEKSLPHPVGLLERTVPQPPEVMREAQPAFQQTPADEETPSKAIAPPISTPSLMALLTPQRVYQPPLAVASTTIQNGAKQEAEDSSPVDLSVLAAQIKQILDEESRRHGIPV